MTNIKNQIEDLELLLEVELNQSKNTELPYWRDLWLARARETKILIEKRKATLAK